MGWGEQKGPRADIAARRLAVAVRRFIAVPNTGNRETMERALEFFDEVDK